MLKKVSQARP